MSFQIVIKKLQGDKMILDVEPDDTIRSIKVKIGKSESLLPQQQRLLYSGKNLKDEATLSDYRINGGSNVYLVTKLYV